MSAEVIDFVELLDAQAERVAKRLGNEPDLGVDGGQSAYNALPPELQRTFVHLASLMKDAPEWPTMKLIVAVAEYHNADIGCALCMMGWMPKRELSEAEARCLELSKQVALGLSYEIEEGGQADLTAARKSPIP